MKKYFREWQTGDQPPSEDEGGQTKPPPKNPS